LPPYRFTLPEGFEIELVAGPPLVMRPMMADFDEQGRLYVADSSGSNDKVEKQLEEKRHRIVRLEDTNGDGRFDTSVVFADRLMFPEGVLWHDGAIYTGAPPSIWRLEDTDGDGVADVRTEWHQGKTLTGCANDLHGPFEGPDGWIYWCKGAFAQQTYERPGRRTISDHAAHIFRALPDHTELDSVMGGGMDNPVEVAFSPEGECFFITTFFHHPEAGRRDAIVHAIYGGAYPKVHGVVDALQRTGELMPPMVELGPAAGCSLARYDSRVFGADFENNLFSAEFNLRRVRRHILTPFGSTYRSENHDFLVADNPDFHPTDVFEDADGSLLVIDTGGWYKICCPTSQLPKPDVLGGIYRIRPRLMPKVEDPRGTRMKWEEATAHELASRLDDPRSAVRQRSVRGLASAGFEAVRALTEVLRGSGSIVARRNAVWALTRMDGERARAAARLALDDADAGVRQAALHSVAMRRDAVALSRVLGFLESGNPFHRRKACEALGRMGRGEAVPALLAAAAKAGEGLPDDAVALRIHEHASIYALIEIGDADGTRRGLASGEPGTRRAALIALDQMDGGGLRVEEVSPLLGSGDPLLRSTAVWIAANHPEWGGALSSYFRDRLAAGVPSMAAGAELQRQLIRFAKDPAIQQLMADKVRDTSLPRETVLLVLRSMAEAGLGEAPAEWIGGLVGCLERADVDLVRAAIATVRGLPLEKAEVSDLSLQLRRLAADKAMPEDLRVSALAALGGGAGGLEEETFALLLRRIDPGLVAVERGAAAGVLAGARLTQDQLLRLADAMKLVGPMEMNRLLDAFSGTTNEAVGLAWVAALEASRARSSLRTDVLRQRLDAFPRSVQDAGQELLAKLDVNAEEQNARLTRLLEELSGIRADVRRGQTIFNSPQTACATCHAIGYLGGRLGPDLTSIGQIRTERDLLEALMYPNASFVRSFEPVIVTTNEGDEYGGVVASESAEEIVLSIGADVRVRVAKADVAELRPGSVSVMPSGLEEQLSKQELADLLAFLKNTRWGAQ
jgi:putative membrane-bound dehydrogenase-like protein